MIARIALRLARDVAAIPVTALVVWLAVAALPPSDQSDSKESRSAEIAQQLRSDLGIGQPLGFLKPWRDLASGKRLGHGPRALDALDLARALSGSLRIGGLALLLALAIAAGIAALRVARSGPARLAGELLPTVAYGTPVFLVALAVAIRTGISLGDDTASFEPTVALVVGAWPGAFLGTLLGDALRAERERPYFAMALAKGRSPAAALLLHALPNALPTLLDAFPPVATALLTGSFAAEKLFNVTYFGFLYVHAALERQGALVVVATTVFAALLVAVTLVSRIARLAVDPRTRDAGEAA